MARAHKVTVGGYVRFAANATDARHQRDSLLEELGMKKSEADPVEVVEIPTGKAELIPFLNELLEATETTFKGDGNDQA